MSPHTRTRTATARPYSCRKTRSISAVARTGIPVPSVLKRTDLDGQGCENGRQFPAPLERGVEIRNLDDIEAPDMLLAFREWPVGHDQVVVLPSQHRGRLGGMQPAGEYPHAGSFELVVERIHFLHDRFEDVRRGWGAVRLIDAE